MAEISPLEQATAAIRNGDLIVFPTDTVYALAADPGNSRALQKIYALKGRPPEKPIPLLIDNESRLSRLLLPLPPTARKMIEDEWPGALTIVGQASPNHKLKAYTDAETLAVRLPDCEIARTIIRLCGGVLAATSINQSGQPPLQTAGEIADAFGEQLAVIIAGDDEVSGRPSKIVDFSGDQMEVLR